MTHRTTARAGRRAVPLAHRPAHGIGARAAEREKRHADNTLRRLAFGAVVTIVLAVGGYLAFGDFLGRGGPSEGAIPVQASMAGFTPSEIHVKAGEAVTLDFWTQDSPLHLRNGVHTMISDELGLREELPGASAGGTSRVAVGFRAPMKPGSYDIYCDTCCGGRASPSMHGRIVVEA